MADPVSMTPLEQQVMKDYGQYTYKAVDVPAYNPNVRRSINPIGGFGMMNRLIGRNRYTQDQYNQDLANLGAALPKGVILVGNQLRVTPEAEKLYAMDATKNNMLTAIRNQAATEAQLKAYNDKLIAQGNQPVTALPTGMGGMTTMRAMGLPSLQSFGGTSNTVKGIGAIGGMGGLGTLNRLKNVAYNGPLDILGGNTVATPNNMAFGNINRLAGRARYPQMTSGTETRNLDQALQEYLRLNPGMSLDQLRAQQEAKRNAMATMITSAPQALGQNMTLDDLNNKYVAQQPLPVNFAEGGEVKGYAFGGRASIFGIGQNQAPAVSYAGLSPRMVNISNMGRMADIPMLRASNIGVGSQDTAPVNIAPEMTTAEYEAKVQAIRDAAYAAMKNKYAEGGEVKGYADGGEYDPTDPNFAGQVQENMAANPLYAYREVPQVAQVPAVRAPSAVEEALAQRRAILADLNKALVAQPAGSTMSDAEKYWRLAAAFGKTGKTGHFAESLGSVGDTMADITAEKRKEAKEQAALALQRLQARSELATQQYGLAREAEMQDLLKKYLTKGKEVTSDVASGATQSSGGTADNIPDDLKALILAQPTDKAVSTIIDIAKENNKPSDLIKGINFLVNNGTISREEGAAIVKENLQGKLEQVDVNVGELGGTFKMTGPEAREYYDKGILPSRLGGKPKAAPAGTVKDTTVVPSAPAAGANKPMSQEQVKAQETALQEQAKADIEEGKTLVGQKQFANDQINASKRVLGLAKTNPQAFGLTANPGLFNAVSSIVENGVSTPWGSFNINVEEPLSKLKLKPEELQARRQAVQALTQIEIGYRKLFLKGEGAVSNMEGALASRLGPEIKDDPKTVQIKAGLIQIAAEKQNAIIDGYQKYKAQHPAAGPQAFYQTPEYQRIYNGYENKYAAFAKKAGIPLDDVLSNTPTKGATGGKLVDTLKNDPRWND